MSARSSRGCWQLRIERAELLASRHAFAREVLKFYGHIARFQKQLYEGLPRIWGRQAVGFEGGDLRAPLPQGVLGPHFENFLALIESCGTGPLATHARRLRLDGDAQWAQILETFWRARRGEASAADLDPSASVSEPLNEFLAHAFLQPCAEAIAETMLPFAPPMTVCRCPRCDSLPVLGVLRPEGEGGKRYLQCSFCSTEWEFRRIFCPQCGEDREEQLPVYIAEQFPYIRMESCESCRRFLRTIDLTKDGRAVPLVDDLAAIPLSLWAEEQGYTRIQGNLLGT